MTATELDLPPIQGEGTHTDRPSDIKDGLLDDIGVSSTTITPEQIPRLEPLSSDSTVSETTKPLALAPPVPQNLETPTSDPSVPENLGPVRGETWEQTQVRVAKQLGQQVTRLEQ